MAYPEVGIDELDISLAEYSLVAVDELDIELSAVVPPPEVAKVNILLMSRHF